MDNSPKIINGVVHSVYRHSPLKGTYVLSFESHPPDHIFPALSLESVHQSLLRLSEQPNEPTTVQSVYFLTEGICIEAKQSVLSQKATNLLIVYSKVCSQGS